MEYIRGISRVTLEITESSPVATVVVEKSVVTRVIDVISGVVTKLVFKSKLI